MKRRNTWIVTLIAVSMTGIVLAGCGSKPVDLSQTSATLLPLGQLEPAQAVATEFDDIPEVQTVLHTEEILTWASLNLACDDPAYTAAIDKHFVANSNVCGGNLLNDPVQLISPFPLTPVGVDRKSNGETVVSVCWDRNNTQYVYSDTLQLREPLDEPKTIVEYTVSKLTTAEKEELSGLGVDLPEYRVRSINETGHYCSDVEVIAQTFVDWRSTPLIEWLATQN